MKRKIRKLALDPQVIRVLQQSELARAAGAHPTASCLACPEAQ